MHPDQTLRDTVVERFTHGADIGFRGEHVTHIATNNKSASMHANAVTTAIQLEVARGHTRGPFAVPPLPNFRINPLSARIKPDGTARLILDLSQPAGDSINDGIDPAEFSCSYTSVEAAIALIFEHGGRGALLAKADIKHAFRLIPVRPDQWCLLGFHWQGQLYFDIRLSFGSRSSPRIFNDFADCLEWLFSQHANSSAIRHYLDDFFLVAPDAATATRTYQTILNLAAELGVPLAADKCTPPTTRLTLLGVVLDTQTMTISLPPDKVEGILSSLSSLQHRSKATKHELLSVVGKLVHASKCVPPGRAFTRRILNAALTVVQPRHRVRITTQLRRDLRWWLEFLPRWNGSFPLIAPIDGRAHTSVYTDSSRLAGAAVHGDRWIAFTWPLSATEAAACSMSWLEMVPILAAVMTWGHLWRGQRVRIHCDNMGVVAIWRRGWSHSPLLMDAIRHLLFLAATAECILDLTYIRSGHNTVADALSRGRAALARRHHPGLRAAPCPVPATLDTYLAAPHTNAPVLSGRPL